MSAPTVAQAIDAKRTLEMCVAAMLAEYAKDYGVEVSAVHVSAALTIGERYGVEIDVRIPGLTR